MLRTHKNGAARDGMGAKSGTSNQTAVTCAAMSSRRATSAGTGSASSAARPSAPSLRCSRPGMASNLRQGYKGLGNP